MTAQVAGPIATGIANRKAVVDDIMMVTSICLVIVILSIGFYFRRLRAIPLTGIPAVIGAAIAFGVAELAFGYLTESTSFLGSIIVGNGINYAIVLMSRYEEHRARGEDPERGAGRGAGRRLARDAGGVDRRLGRLRIADGDQLPRLLPVRRHGRGRLAGLLAATFTALPALLVLLDRRPAAAPAPAPTAHRILARWRASWRAGAAR